MMKIFGKYLLGISLFSLTLAGVFGISVQIPTPSGQEDIIVATSTVESDESTLFDIIQIINDYLWFAIAGIAMIVLIYAGIKLIIAEGNKEDVSTANRMIVSSMLAIFASMLSYAAIKLIVNLF